jgi:hypothetical protein
MIRITDEPSGTLVRVDGWLGGEGVDVLLRVLKSSASPARLLLHDLRGADAAGLSVLRQLAQQGTSLEGLSTYMQLTLAGPASIGPLEPHHPARPETPVRSTET